MTSQPATDSFSPDARFAALDNDVAALRDEVEELHTALRGVTARPSPWPWVAVSVIWTSAAAATAALAALMPDNAWDKGAGWAIAAVVFSAVAATWLIA